MEKKIKESRAAYRHILQDLCKELWLVAAVSPGCFAKWREGREWLTVTTDRSVQFTACSEIKDLGPYTQERLHIDPAFIHGVKAKTAKTLQIVYSNTAIV